MQDVSCQRSSDLVVFDLWNAARRKYRCGLVQILGRGGCGQQLIGPQTPVTAASPVPDDRPRGQVRY